MTPAAARRTDGVRRGLLAAAPLLLAGCGPASIVDPAGSDSGKHARGLAVGHACCRRKTRRR